MMYARAVRELEARGIMPDSMPSLQPMQRALALAQLVIPRERNIIVAGTNGKGTTAATLHALLLTRTPRVGLYTSPHLVTTRERIRLGDPDLSEADFVRAYLAMKPIITAQGLTHFEALTLMAAHVFYSGDYGRPMDYVIWEVGLGGMFDATNAIPHLHAAITHLGLDHQNLLGQSLYQIARQKFGVIGPCEGGTRANVVYSPMPDELSDLRDEVAAQTACRWIPAGAGVISDWVPSSCSMLPGQRAAENTLTALTLYAALGFDPRPALPALEQVRWPGRFSHFEDPRFSCPIYLSGDHNAPGVESLLEILSHRSWRQLHVVAGIGRDKDAAGMLAKLLTLPRVRLYLTQTPFKPLLLSEYPSIFRNQAEQLEPDSGRLLTQLAPQVAPDDLVVVTGSLYLVGQVMSEGARSSAQGRRDVQGSGSPRAMSAPEP